MEPLRVIGSRWKQAPLLMGNLLALAIGLRAVLTGEHVVAGWLLAGAMTALLPVLVRRIASPPPRLVIDRRGVFVQGLAARRIPWREIEGAWVRAAPGGDRVRLEIRHPERFARRRGGFLGWPTGEADPIDIDARNLGLSTVDVLERIVSSRVPRI